MRDETVASTRAGWSLAAVVGLGALLALVAPLGDPDLPEHLAIGEWIVRHGAVPHVEPFAWTRAGQPYFAYSWLVEATYFLALSRAGPWALHVLQALVGVGAVLSAALYARVRGWGRETAAALGALNYTVMASVANQLRPEQLLFVLVPLAWVLADSLLEEGGASDAGSRGTRGSGGLIAGHAVLGCAAANVHIFFPLTAAPFLLRLLGGSPPARRRLLAALAALAAGWLISPYGLDWPAVYRLNFTPNALLSRPPAIEEMRPGFETALEMAGAAIAAIVLIALPWIPVSRAELAPGARVRIGGRRAWARGWVVEALAWAGGLVLFAFAFRLIAVWWLLSLPAVGARARAAAAALVGRKWVRLAVAAALGIAMLVTLAPPWPSELRLEGGVGARTLPTPAAAAARPLAEWLACRTDPRSGGRILTSFNYGSYLTWRLPGYSVSIDGRTIFPDSVSREFGWTLAGRRIVHAQTWRSADLAILPRWLALNDVLAGGPGWQRIAITGPPDGRPGSGRGAALWVRRDWWAAAHRPRSSSCMR